MCQTNNDSIKRPLNGFTLNLLGEATIVSLNVEKLFPISKNIILIGEIGVGASIDFCGAIHCEDDYKSKTPVTFPHYLTVNFGKRRSFLETGYSSTFLLLDKYPAYIPSALVGYRIQPMLPEKFVFRVFIQVPLLSGGNELKQGSILFIPIGISFGSSF